MPTVTRRIAAVLLVLGACAGSGFEFITNDAEQLFVKVPEDWTIYDDADYETALAGTEGITSLELARESVSSWLAAFTADGAGIAAALEPVGSAPAGFVLVWTLNSAERDAVSLAELRRLGWTVDGQPVDPLEVSEQPRAPLVVVADEEVVVDGRARGVRIRAQVDGLADVTVTREVLTLVDHETTRIYMLVIGCEVRCFRDHLDAVETVLDSFTIEERT